MRRLVFRTVVYGALATVLTLTHFYRIDYVLWHFSVLREFRTRRGQSLRFIFVGAGLDLLWCGVICGLELLFPAGTWVAGPRRHIMYNLHSRHVWMLSGLMLLPLALCVAYGWRLVGEEAKRIAFLAIPYIGLHFVMAKCDEVRFWLNLYILLGPFMALSYQRLAYRTDAI